MLTREERAAEAARLKAEGLNGVQIAKRMGVARSYAYELLSDPDGAAVRLRKRSYGKRCIDCGDPTDGSNGHEKAPDRCGPCGQRERHWQACLRAIAAIRRFHDRYGEPPRATDFNPAMARAKGQAWRAERYRRDGDYVPASGVQALFGSWAAGVRAAGLVPGVAGYYGRPGEDPAVVAETVRLYLERRDLTVAEIAARLGITPETVRYRLKKAGVERNRHPGRRPLAA